VAVGAGMDSMVSSMTLVGGSLCRAAHSPRAGSAAVPHIAYWEGHDWSASAIHLQGKVSMGR
jgi:hypothetical protein